jgi:rSAM/selenodomain-associated transferase 1
MVMAANALVILTKVPEPGQSKTRLVPPLSFAEAAELARALLIDQLNNLSKFNTARLFIAFAPPAADTAFFENLATPELSCFPQKGKSLGNRMRYAFQHLFDTGFNNIVLIGSDLPVIPLPFFRQAYDRLEQNEGDVVLGPSEDGGYYLIGMKRLIPDIFEGIAWSRGEVLARTVEKLHRLNRKYELLPLWYDIDRADDLERLSRDIAAAGMMKNTFAVLNELKRTGRL